MKMQSWLGLGGASLVLLAASCAESDSARDPESTDPSTILDASANEPADTDAGAVDGACTDGASCAPDSLCATSDFCPTTLSINGRFVLTAIWGSSKDDVWAVGSGGVIVHWDGTSWTSIASNTAITLRAVGGNGPNDLWFVGSRDGIHRSVGLKNGAMAWAPKPAPVTPFNSEWTSEILLNAVWVDGTSDVWVAGEPARSNGTCSNRWRAERVDVPTTPITAWDPLAEPDCITFGFNTIFALSGVGSDDLWAVGGGLSKQGGPTVGRTFRMRRGATAADGGMPSWEELDCQADVPLLAVWGTTEGGVWAVGENGTIRHYAPGDARWSIVPSPTVETLRSVWGSGPDDVWAVGDRSTILHFDGVSWNLATSASTVKSNLFGIWGSSAADVWVVGEGTVLHASGKKP